MNLPKRGRGNETAARTASRAAGRKRYPLGKALARIRYFETQRGVALTRYERGRVSTGNTARTTPRRRSRAHAAEAKPPRVPYVAAAAAKARLEPPGFAAAAHLPVWRELGPLCVAHGQTYGKSRPPVSGRCVGLFIDPSDPRRLIVCSAGGGLWGSRDRGRTWNPLTDFEATLSMGAIAGAPDSPNIVYAGTGEGDIRSPLGMGIFRSSDGGWTWIHVRLAALSGTGIFDIAVDPADHLHIWIAAVNGLHESRDGGETARVVRAGLTWDVSINPANPREILVASDSGLLRSANGGKSWSRVALPGMIAGVPFERMEVCHAPSDPKVVYVAAATDARAFLWRRASASGPFRAEAPPRRMDISQAWYDWCFAVSPADPNLVFWGAIELYRGKRTNTGMRWSNISTRRKGDSIHPDQHHIEFDPGDARTIYVCNDGGLFRSPDQGTTWAALNPGLGVTEFEFLAQMESDTSWVIGGTQDNGTLECRPARNWKHIAEGDGGDCAVSDGRNPLCFHSYYGMWIERAAAKGAKAFRWKDVSPPASEEYPALFYPPMDLCGSVLAKAGCSLFVSDDAGDSWTEVLLPTSNDEEPDLASALAVYEGGVVYLGTAYGRVYRITRGAGWKKAKVEALKSPREGFISDIIVPTPGSKTIWATCSAFGGAHVFRSINGGRTWANRSGNLPDIPVNAMVVDPSNPKHLYAATDNGVYRSTDAGARWLDFSNGLPNALVGDLILHVCKRLLRAGTRNRGCWEVAI